MGVPGCSRIVSIVTFVGFCDFAGFLGVMTFVFSAENEKKKKLLVGSFRVSGDSFTK